MVALSFRSSIAHCIRASGQTHDITLAEFHAQVPCDMAQTGRLKLVVGHCLKYGLERAEQRSGENEFSDHGMVFADSDETKLLNIAG